MWISVSQQIIVYLLKQFSYDNYQCLKWEVLCKYMKFQNLPYSKLNKNGAFLPLYSIGEPVSKAEWSVSVRIVSNRNI